jgi:hypothetical protein
MRMLRVAPLFLWATGTCALLVAPGGGWRSVGREAIATTATAVDRSNPRYAKHLLLLGEARQLIPVGQCYTAIARNADDEMLLFMLSLGVLPDRAARPTSYWGTPRVGQGDRARYVVSLDCLEPTGPHRLLEKTPDGCVWERPEQPR